MRRREFIAGLGSAAAWPLAARAQQTGKLPTIGFMGTDASLFGPRTAAFVERLRQLGWTDGRTIAIEYGWSEALPERFAEIAADFVRLKVDVILANGDAEAAITVASRRCTGLGWCDAHSAAAMGQNEPSKHVRSDGSLRRKRPWCPPAWAHDPRRVTA